MRNGLGTEDQLFRRVPAFSRRKKTSSSHTPSYRPYIVDALHVSKSPLNSIQDSVKTFFVAPDIAKLLLTFVVSC